MARRWEAVVRTDCILRDEKASFLRHVMHSPLDVDAEPPALRDTSIRLQRHLQPLLHTFKEDLVLASDVVVQRWFTHAQSRRNIVQRSRMKAAFIEHLRGR